MKLMASRNEELARVLGVEMSADFVFVDDMIVGFGSVTECPIVDVKLSHRQITAHKLLQFFSHP